MKTTQNKTTKQIADMIAVALGQIIVIKPVAR